jgi:hypothetical protein
MTIDQFFQNEGKEARKSISSIPVQKEGFIKEGFILSRHAPFHPLRNGRTGNYSIDSRNKQEKFLSL